VACDLLFCCGRAMEDLRRGMSGGVNKEDDDGEGRRDEILGLALASVIDDCLSAVFLFFLDPWRSPLRSLRNSLDKDGLLPAAPTADPLRAGLSGGLIIDREELLPKGSSVKREGGEIAFTFFLWLGGGGVV
jgi:hypothetical protein